MQWQDKNIHQENGSRCCWTTHRDSRDEPSRSALNSQSRSEAPRFGRCSSVGDGPRALAVVRRVLATVGESSRCWVARSEA